MCKGIFISHAPTHSGAQEIPSDLEPILFMDAVHADLLAACPTGIEKCECMHAPGSDDKKSHISYNEQDFKVTSNLEPIHLK